MSLARLQSRSSAPLRTRPAGVRAGALAALLALALLTIAASARADIGERIILRCTHNESLSGFSQSDYKKALEELEADTVEYGSCSSRIREAELAAAAAGRGGGGGASGLGAAAAPLAATPAEQRAIVHAQHAGSEPVQLGSGQVVHPGVVHVDVASALSALPTPVLTILAFLLAGLLLVAGGALRKRARGRAD
ncbi:MAG TPA: hypothetical protein VMD79_15325 [Solirubrobacteraceae bacterium]|nr:hypothetical protein [Solirubrobacteraceae bacterium]